MIILLTPAYNLLESLTGNYSLIWSGLIVLLLSATLIYPQTEIIVFSNFVRHWKIKNNF